MAIARDNNTTGDTVASGLTITHSSYVNAGDLMIVFLYEENADDFTAVSFNTTELFTESAKTHLCYSAGSNTHTLSAWYLKSPTATTADVVATRSSSTGHAEMWVVSYSGTNTSSQPDGTATAITGTPGTCGSGATNLSTNVTVTASNCWTAGFARFDNGGTVSGSGTFTKIAQGGSGELAIEATFDSNGTVSTGSQASGLTGATAGSAIGLVVLSIAPAAAASGPANMKTWNGLAKASIKTMNGLAIASVKTWNGLT